MKIYELFNKKRTLSFEVFPPKRADVGTKGVFATIDALKELSPDYISVTYGASGSNSRNAAEIAGYIKKSGIEPLAHLTGGPSSPEDIDRTAEEFLSLGVENVLALRGDKPVDYEAEYCKYFPHATDLMEYLKKYPFALAGAAYPSIRTLPPSNASRTAARSSSSPSSFTTIRIITALSTRRRRSALPCPSSRASCPF